MWNTQRGGGSSRRIIVIVATGLCLPPACTQHISGRLLDPSEANQAKPRAIKDVSARRLMDGSQHRGGVGGGHAACPHLVARPCDVKAQHAGHLAAGRDQHSAHNTATNMVQHGPEFSPEHGKKHAEPQRNTAKVMGNWPD